MCRSNILIFCLALRFVDPYPELWSFLVQNLFYNKEQDFYHRSEVVYYEAKRCEGCPLRGMCHKTKGNRRIEVYQRLNKLKERARELLTDEKGLKMSGRSRGRFGQLKSNNKFNRFTFIGLEKVEMEFLLMALGHNLRKMAAKGATSDKIIVKITKTGV